MDDHSDDPSDRHHRSLGSSSRPSPSPWNRRRSPPAHQEQQHDSHSNTARSLFGSGSASLFGSGGNMDGTDHMERPERPELSLTAPSQEQVPSGEPSTQPTLSDLLASSSSRRERRYEDEIRATANRRRIPQIEKDADDTTNPPVSRSSQHDRQTSNTLTTLSRLFAVQTSSSPTSSRSPSYIVQAPHRTVYTRQPYSETAGLPDHLYTRGLLEGRHSDITVQAYGKGYRLHRLVLDRAPFFATALSPPWLEAGAREMTVRPDEIDTAITQHAFELALKRLYGSPDVIEEDADAVGLFATGCWLEMPDLIEASIESMLRQMSPETLAPLIILVTRNYYGRAGEKILASAKAMLCRDGWKMPLRYWDGIPGDIVREIVGGDGFFVDGEMERWVLAKRILDRRLKTHALEAGLTEPGNSRKVLKAPDTLGLMAIRFDGVSRRSMSPALSRGLPDHLHKYIGLYTHPSIEPLLVLLDEGIHFVHLEFEQLQFIRSSRDALGLPVMPEKVVSNALWQQMELRQRVMNARETDLELGLAVQSAEETSDIGETFDGPATASSNGKGKAIITDPAESDSDEDSGSWDGNGKPRKFWIPSADCNIVMGGNVDPIMAPPSRATAGNRQSSRLSATVAPEDVQWASDFASQPRPSTSDGSTMQDTPPPAVKYTHLPPFRFSAEFPSPRSLKEKRRVYSRTVFYAGSLWNIYIQKVASARSTKQLGVYLHRARSESEEEDFRTGKTAAAQAASGVEARIGLLEHEMRARNRDIRRGQEDVGGRHDESEGSTLDGADDIANIAGIPPDTAAAAVASSSRGTRMRDLLSSSSRHNREANAAAAALSPTSFTFGTTDHDSSDSDDDSFSTDPLRKSHPPSRPLSGVPALPAYVDHRPTIITYFKIYSPSRGGRMLSIYESAPDKFNFAQSWGWKSSTLMLDEGLLTGEEGEMQLGVLEPDGATGGDGGPMKEEGKRGAVKGKGDGKLRFMVVIGNI